MLITPQFRGLSFDPQRDPITTTTARMSRNNVRGPTSALTEFLRVSNLFNGRTMKRTYPMLVLWHHTVYHREQGSD